MAIAGLCRSQTELEVKKSLFPRQEDAATVCGRYAPAVTFGSLLVARAAISQFGFKGQSTGASPRNFVKTNTLIRIGRLRIAERCEEANQKSSKELPLGTLSRAFWKRSHWPDNPQDKPEAWRSDFYEDVLEVDDNKRQQKDEQAPYYKAPPSLFYSRPPPLVFPSPLHVSVRFWASRVFGTHQALPHPTHTVILCLHVRVVCTLITQTPPIPRRLSPLRMSAWHCVRR